MGESVKTWEKRELGKEKKGDGMEQGRGKTEKKKKWGERRWTGKGHFCPVVSA